MSELVKGGWIIHSNRKNVCAGVPTALFVRSDGISLDTDCGIPSTDIWPNLQVEGAVSTMRIKEKVLLLYNESQAGLCRDQKGVLAC
jgi:hypothetical protein